MKFPYGLCDFYDIINEDYFYVDRTDRIPEIEKAGKHLIFLRPRRFGKTLLLSVLENYYDIARAGDFEKLFGHLTVGKNPTDRHNQYFILKWDFSSVSPHGGPEKIQQGMYDYINSEIRAFAKYYQTFLTDEIIINSTNAQDSFQSLLTAVRQTNRKLYLLIDEYDNFANEVMMGTSEISPERYTSLVYGEGCIKSLFKVVKSATAGRGLDRTFITGVSPVVMSDITSGHNIAESIYLKPGFNDLCGFSEQEIADTLGKIARDCDLPEERILEALDMIRKYYNGYCFSSRSDGLVYNPTLALYFMKAFQDDCEYPEDMLDENLLADRGKIAYISRLPGGEEVIADAVNEKEPLTVYRLARRFGVEDMLYAVKDRTFMASLLYFLGVLTMGGRNHFGELVLKIPNLVSRKLYIERIREMLIPDTARARAGDVARTFYTTGDMRPLCDFIEQTYFRVLDNRDYRWADEMTIKTAFLTLLFNDTLYIMDSETELDRGYADMTMILRPDMRHSQLSDNLMEFKYVSLKEAGLSGAEVRELSRDEIKKLVPVKEKFDESEIQLKRYRRTLEKSYGDVLRLRTYSVVAVGFDRLVWREIERTTIYNGGNYEKK